MSVDTTLTYNVSYSNYVFDKSNIKENGILKFNKTSGEVSLYGKYESNHLNSGFIKDFNVGDEFIMEDFKVHVESEASYKTSFQPKRRKLPEKKKRVPIYSKSDINVNEISCHESSFKNIPFNPQKFGQSNITHKENLSCHSSPLKRIIECINPTINSIEISEPSISLSNILSSIRNNKSDPNENVMVNTSNQLVQNKPQSIFEKCWTYSKNKFHDEFSSKQQPLNDITLSTENPYESFLTWHFQHVVFPSQKSIKKIGAINFKRTSHIPNQFNSLDDYRTSFGKTIMEDLNLQMLSIAQKYHSHFKSKMSASEQKRSQKFIPKTNIPVYSNCELVVTSLPALHFQKK